jgi:hypothetical protein
MASHLAEMMQQDRTLLVDIRLSPHCRWNASWESKALAATYGRRYVWERRLGNLNYRHRERGIQLAEGHQTAISKAAALLRDGVSLLLLCACKEASTCHRSLVEKLIREALQEGVQA